MSKNKIGFLEPSLVKIYKDGLIVSDAGSWAWGKLQSVDGEHVPYTVPHMENKHQPYTQSKTKASFMSWISALDIKAYSGSVLILLIALRCHELDFPLRFTEIVRTSYLTSQQ